VPLYLPQSEIDRIEVINLDKWVDNFWREQNIDKKIIFLDSDTKHLWEQAYQLLSVPIGIEFFDTPQP